MQASISHEAAAWVSLMRYFDWNRVAVIYTTDHGGNQFISKFEHLADNIVGVS